jgi:hypothetical protein
MFASELPLSPPEEAVRLPLESVTKEPNCAGSSVAVTANEPPAAAPCAVMMPVPTAVAAPTPDAAPTLAPATLTAVAAPSPAAAPTAALMPVPTALTVAVLVEEPTPEVTPPPPNRIGSLL